MRTQDPSRAYVQTVEEIKKIYRSLPQRPSIEEVEAAESVVQSVKDEEQSKLGHVSNREIPPGVPPELYSVLQKLRKKMVVFQSNEQRRDAVCVLELEDVFRGFDELIRRAHELVSGEPQTGKEIDHEIESGSAGGWNKTQKQGVEEPRPDAESRLGRSSSTKASLFSASGGQKLGLMKVAAFIENTAKAGDGVLDLQGKLMDQIQWLPASIGKLMGTTELNLSENSLMAVPSAVGNLSALTKLDLHSNQLVNIPESISELKNLTNLDLHANLLTSLPSFADLNKLVYLNLSSNRLISLPDTIGNLTDMKTLNADTNELEELPYSIGSCSSITELRLDFNRIRALPEAIGKLKRLEILTLHYNRIRGLPTTMGNLSSLRELDLSFNELQNVPENLCFAVGLQKLNLGKNFADLKELPNSIGNLEMLEELDISDNQIRTLPVSFGYLSNLRVFHAEETPLEMPPEEVTKKGAQDVVRYIAESVTRASEEKKKKKKKMGFKSYSCFFIFSWRRRNQEN